MSRNGDKSEDGAILILALVYLIVISVVVAFLSTWATNDLNNSAAFSSANSLTVAASGMTDQAIQYVRYNPQISNSQTVLIASPLIPCWGGTSTASIPAIDGDQVAVWCSTVWSPLVAATRTVTFYACPISMSAAGCATPLPGVGGGAPTNNWLLKAVVVYDDYPPAPAKSAPIQDLCSVYCGSGMTIVSWQWGPYGAPTSAGVAASISFSNEPSDTTANGTTEASVTVLDASNIPVAGDTVTLVEQSGPANGISAPTSTLAAITNPSGVAVFSNIVPQTAGTYTVTAVDGTATATSTNFIVGQQRSVITTSTAPATAIVGGAKYNVSATATTGDTVAITDATTSICTMTGGMGSGVVTFVSPGTCTLDFNDPATGNPNYSPALQVVQSILVGGTSASQVGIVLGSKQPNASTTTNDSVTVTLENGAGTPVTSAGTTPVVLSDPGAGFFAATNGVAGANTLVLTFGPGVGVQTAYFGNNNTGPDTISAINQTTLWGTAALTVVGGAPAQVLISPSTTSPAVSSNTNTSVVLQLQDQSGNFTTGTTATTITLSDSSGGFFANSSGSAGSATLAVTFPAGVGIETVYYGNENMGADTITGKNGGAVWGTSSVTTAAGVATQVVVTLSPNPPAASLSTNTTVTLQLEDQFGNAVQTSGVSLTLTDTGSGFFAPAVGTSNSTATPTLTVTTNGSGVATGSFGDSLSETITITATGPGYSGSTSSFNVS